MEMEGWLDDTRTSYDTVAVGYAERVRDLLNETPYERSALALFAELAGRPAEARSRTWDAVPEGSRPIYGGSAWTRSVSTCRRG
ncbi:hypothetical protein [Streptomyces sp. MBT27]|uniref:hypothetical protein n=1 Tax=Streptomyces sp. MBT27 TaxID=1488356 RepID=UPI001F08366D|nr:hypothetical protein [Streptomyces sp. MBT27]